MVAPECDQRVVRLTARVEGIEHAAELRVHVTDAGIVGVQGGAGLGGGEIAVGVEVEITTGVARVGDGREGGFVGEVRRQGQRLGFVKIEKLLRCFEGNVRFLETDSEKKGLRGSVVAFEKTDRRIRDRDVRCAFADRDGAEVVCAAAQGLDHLRGGRVVAVVVVVFREGPEVRLGALLLGALGRGEPCVFAARLRRICGVDLAVVARLVPDLAELGAGVTVLLEMLRQGWMALGRGEPGLVVKHAGGGGILAAEDGAARGIAERVVAVSTIKADATGGEAVEVRCLRHRITVGGDAAIEVIDDDEEDVGFFRGLGGTAEDADCAEDGEAEFWSHGGLFHSGVRPDSMA